MNIDIAMTIRALLLPCLRKNEFLRFEDCSNEHMDVIRIVPHQDDVPLVIGRQGTNLITLKELAKECGAVHSRAVKLLVADSEPREPHTARAEWSLELCQAGLNKLFETLKLPSRCAIVEGRKGRSNVMLTEPLPDPLKETLMRWLHVMGQGKTFLIFDEDTAATAEHEA